MTRTRPRSFFDRIVAWSFDRPLPILSQYLVAALVITTVGVLRALFITDALPWLLFIPAILGVALVTGKGPGLVAACLATAVGVLTIGSPSNPAWLNESQAVAATLFLLVNVALVLLTAELRASMRRALDLNAELVASETAAAEDQLFLSSVLAASTDCIKVLELDGTLSFMSEGGMKTMEIGDFNAVKGCPWPDFMKDGGIGLARTAISAAREGRSSHFESSADTFLGTPKFWSISVSPIMDAQGTVARILSVSRDHSALEEARKQQRLLNDELGHRLKNVLAMVQSIANQTLRDADSLESASAAFTSRLASLGQATDVLTASSWQAAELHDVLDAGLAAVQDKQGRISSEGPAISLNSHTALALTLALHELATNATKYGALSNEAGTVTIRWQLTDRDGAPHLTFLWQEQGGPPVSSPTRRGFGSRMIERSLRSYFRGETALSYPVEGVEFRIDAPLSGAGKA